MKKHKILGLPTLIPEAPKNNLMEALSSNLSRIITSDIYLAAYLLSQRLTLAKVVENDRCRVSFVVEGKKAKELKTAYIEGPVLMDVRSFKGCLNYIRDLLTQRKGATHVRKENKPIFYTSLNQA